MTALAWVCALMFAAAWLIQYRAFTWQRRAADSWRRAYETERKQREHLEESIRRAARKGAVQ